MITVVAALIEKNRKYLIAKRATGSKDVLGKWEFPGGKVELGETEMEALKREIKEEFEMDIKPIRFLKNSVYEYSTKKIDLKLYECKYISGSFHLHDHSEYKFVDIEDILNYELCPADIPLAEFVKEELK